METADRLLLGQLYHYDAGKTGSVHACARSAAKNVDVASSNGNMEGI